MKACLTCGSGGHSQIADTRIHANNFGEVFTGRLRYVNGEGNEYIELFLLPVIPEFRVTDSGSLPNTCDMLVIALIGNADAPIQGADTDPAVTLKGVIPRVGYTGRSENCTWGACPSP